MFKNYARRGHGVRPRRWAMSRCPIRLGTSSWPTVTGCGPRNRPGRPALGFAGPAKAGFGNHEWIVTTWNLNPRKKRSSSYLNSNLKGRFVSRVLSPDVQVVEVGPKFERADPFQPGPRPALARPGEDAAIAASSAAMGSVSLTRRRRVIRPGIQRLKAPEAVVVVVVAAPSSASVAPRRPAAAARGPSERRRHLEP